ncbi:PTPLA-domain-containing protein [Myriangium duriaei CBS 260.36]|uniref:Very-long-chain (3R)-3-hydroxyacyl-CoA dehydratase n=1 Tax=Myriangium duriaei CBS 260.36 TaxID=1168546 RepID=A0A9P4J869_9PEZI|nr:PTPLA-domain-containing protein [Myriangium duriaei CBS 260.36]
MFLTLYNLMSAVLWVVVLERTLVIYAFRGPWKVYFGVGDWLKNTQTLALLEVVFSLTGLVRAPVMTTAMQVASRLFLVWGPVSQFTGIAGFSRAYSSMLFAWSVTEVIRYSFFAFSLGLGSVPDFLLWLRYNTFFVLYPIGITSECILIFKTISAALEQNFLLGALWVVVLFVYVPGSYILYTHMMAQRRKVMRAQAEDKIQKTN